MDGGRNMNNSRSVTISLLVEKGKKTWIGKIIDDDFKLSFINESKWSEKRKGVLDFKVREEGLYISQDSTGREYWNIYFLNGELIKEKISKDEVLKNRSNFDLLVKQLKPRKFDFHLYSVTEVIIYKHIENEVTYFAESDEYCLISGKFIKNGMGLEDGTSTHLLRPKMENLQNMIFSKKTDKIRIKFLDENGSGINEPITLVESSI